jgi:membrane protease YdiL (CAAX protease family)
MALGVLIDGVLLIALPLLVRVTSGARLRDLGLSFQQFTRQAAIGIVAALIMTPVVYPVQLFATRIWPIDPEHVHPLMRMLQEQFSLGLAELAILAAVVVAPLFEELMFRAILQSWLIKVLGRFGGARAPAKASIADSSLDLSGDGNVPEEWATPGLIPTGEPMPRCALGRSVWVAIGLTSFVFAGFHLPQWPAPIALFALALVIGFVYHRTGSLITAAFTHATFNGFSTLLLFLALLASHEVEAKKSAEKAEAAWHGTARATVPNCVQAITKAVPATARSTAVDCAQPIIQAVAPNRGS